MAFNASSRIIKHMNDNNSDTILSTLNAQNEIKDKNAKINKLAVNGYFSSSKGKCYFLEFEKIVIHHKNIK